MRYTTPTCKLSIMEAKWGLIPDMSASITLRELLPIDVAKELTMTGRMVSGTEAKDIGLVTRICENPMEEAIQVAQEIKAKSPDSIMGCKRLYQDCWMEPNDQVCLNTETRIQKGLIGGYNQMVASGKNFGVTVLPYKKRKEHPYGDGKDEDHFN